MTVQTSGEGSGNHITTGGASKMEAGGMTIEKGPLDHGGSEDVDAPKHCGEPGTPMEEGIGGSGSNADALMPAAPHAEPEFIVFECLTYEAEELMSYEFGAGPPPTELDLDRGLGVIEYIRACLAGENPEPDSPVSPQDQDPEAIARELLSGEYSRQALLWILAQAARHALPVPRGPERCSVGAGSSSSANAVGAESSHVAAVLATAQAEAPERLGREAAAAAVLPQVVTADQSGAGGHATPHTRASQQPQLQGNREREGVGEQQGATAMQPNLTTAAPPAAAQPAPQTALGQPPPAEQRGQDLAMQWWLLWKTAVDALVRAPAVAAGPAASLDSALLQSVLELLRRLLRTQALHCSARSFAAAAAAARCCLEQRQQQQQQRTAAQAGNAGAVAGTAGADAACAASPGPPNGGNAAPAMCSCAGTHASVQHGRASGAELGVELLSSVFPDFLLLHHLCDVAETLALNSARGETRSAPSSSQQLPLGRPHEAAYLSELAAALDDSRLLEHAAQALLLSLLVASSGPEPGAGARAPPAAAAVAADDAGGASDAGQGSDPRAEAAAQLVSFVATFAASQIALRRTWLVLLQPRPDEAPRQEDARRQAHMRAIAAAGASLDSALAGRCVSHLSLSMTLVSLHAADGGTTYGMPPELLRSLPVLGWVCDEGPVDLQSRRGGVHLLHAAPLLVFLRGGWTCCRHVALDLALRIGRAALASAAAWAELEGEEGALAAAGEGAGLEAPRAAASPVRQEGARDGPAVESPRRWLLHRERLMELIVAALKTLDALLDSVEPEAMGPAAAERWRLAAAAVAREGRAVRWAEPEEQRELGKLLRPWQEPLEVLLPMEGAPSPQPPLELAAALEGGFLGLLERLVRRAGEEPTGREANLLSEMLWCDKGKTLGGVLMYGEPRAATALVVSVGKALRRLTPHLLAWIGSKLFSAGGAGAGPNGPRKQVPAPPTEPPSAAPLLEPMDVLVFNTSGFLVFGCNWLAVAHMNGAIGDGGDGGGGGAAAAAGPAGQAARLVCLAAAEWLPALSQLAQQVAALLPPGTALQGSCAYTRICFSILHAVLQPLFFWMSVLPPPPLQLSPPPPSPRTAPPRVHQRRTPRPRERASASAAGSAAAADAAAAAQTSGAPTGAESLRRLLLHEVGAVASLGAALRLTDKCQVLWEQVRARPHGPERMTSALLWVADSCQLELQAAAAVERARAQRATAAEAARLTTLGPQSVGDRGFGSSGSGSRSATAGRGAGSRCSRAAGASPDAPAEDTADSSESGSGRDPAANGNAARAGECNTPATESVPVAAPLHSWPPAPLHRLLAELRAVGDPMMQGPSLNAVATLLERWREGVPCLLKPLPLRPGPAALALQAAFVPPEQARSALPRACGYPGCTGLAGDSEAELPLRACAGCGDVGYCCRECQTAHWRAGHREACGGRGGGGRARAAGA